MQYRKFGKLDWQVSALGFGAMRLPTLGGGHANIDEPRAIEMIRYAIDNGVNYVDSAYMYHDGNSEKVVGKALKDGYREKVRIATKMPVRMVKKYDDFDRIFAEQMERLQTNKIDFYLFHGLTGESWRFAKKLGIVGWAEQQVAKGHISHIGFSFHDEYKAFKEIVDAYDNWTFCQVQYNLIDVNYQAGRRGVEYAANKGLGIVVMEPLRGGRLAKIPPPPVAQVWDSAPAKRHHVEWALQWVWNQPQISVALSGMSDMEQVKQNLAIASKSGVGSLTPDEVALIDSVRLAYKGLSPIPCTGCNYCMPCPHGVNIPRNFSIFNEGKMWDDARSAKMRYAGQGPGDVLTLSEQANKCQECGECLEACPQAIQIPDWMKQIEAEIGATE